MRHLGGCRVSLGNFTKLVFVDRGAVAWRGEVGIAPLAIKVRYRTDFPTSAHAWPEPNRTTCGCLLDTPASLLAQPTFTDQNGMLQKPLVFSPYDPH